MRITASISKELLNKLIYGNSTDIVEQKLDLRLERMKELTEPTPKLHYIPVGTRETRFQVLLMLLLHFYADGYGFVLHIPKRDLAKQLGCTLRTLNNSLEKLNNRGYITLGYKEQGVIKLLINGYEDAFKTGGTGYYILSEGTFQELVKEDNINRLRIILKGMLDYDAVSLKNKPAQFNKEKLVKTIPAKSYPKAINEILSKKSAAFIMKQGNNPYEFTFILKEEYMGRVVVKEMKTKIGKILQGKFPSLPEKTKMDIIQLAFQYGAETTVDVLDNLDATFVQSNGEIGAYIRRIIEKDFQRTA